MTRAVLYSIGVLALLGACAPSPPGVFRDQDVPIGASTRYDRDGFSGTWMVVEQFGKKPGAVVQFDATADSIRLSGTGSSRIDGTYKHGVPGELIPTGPGRAPLVVMWVDEDFETAAIGTVSGSYGALIDRDGRVPPDRALAARAILDFYGWDVSQLIGTGS